ncbi:hypothetical protein PFAG_06158 [Plasmodium falciparum Santa Lucia]|uniref:Uncharacterized protein n=11 Tax=Plasmodium falciparum TaxID=5833 RepID=C0H533_PLAF7|nr:conserved Plasmodium protein, unknown function [Plasmodium falciparum 3D7]ETW18508.1 hypothetical protein PFFVO_02407 [Plasmodium falciparum Vietnam Oak-Knoll (FVO)]ETW36893.1 hypothetical protein PFTANZ_02475 [Plasmodium falciparum Tanzania (2000708)]ETW43052.1 hypothetical protein PFNF135_02527 [Plasmodium falciparum NF135/5.C10]ETW49475.1 hypothetical protein PFMALIP_02403 [Plasmodium falciparum MaliPS096_E11]ETW61714.1 hypothetical protein PFMC_02366 [Plasmodium falciparum CAMP/Malaysia|eukprot:XP_002808929.1 conserved Plasmodium protein, unknown function [Plasmodium falciparum 3D7]
MAYKKSSSLTIEKRYDNLKTFSKNVIDIFYELKDLVKVHEILIYKEKLETNEKGKYKKHQDELIKLKKELDFIQKENNKINDKLKYYKTINELIDTQINDVSENIENVKLNINQEEQKRDDMKNIINDLKNKYYKSLMAKQTMDDNCLGLTKKINDCSEENKEIKNLIKDLEDKVEFVSSLKNE